jgi:heptosyltransferase-2
MMPDKRREMQETDAEILVWLPSPVGDAVLCTPALRAIRQRFKSSKITFFARPVVCGILSPNSFNDRWLEQSTNNPFATAKMLRAYKFTHAILLLLPPWLFSWQV